MSDTQARRFIIGALLLAGALTTLRHLKNGETPPMRIGFGILIAAVILSLLSEVNPRLAATFAAFAALSVALTNGGALDSLNNLLNRK